MTATTASRIPPPRTAPRFAAIRPREIAGRALHLAGEVAAVLVAAVDGLVVGLVVAFVVAAALSGPAKYLRLVWPLEVVLAGTVAAVVALAGAAAGLVARSLLLGLGGLVVRALDRVLSRRRGRAMLRTVVGLPGRLLRSLPIGWLGALAAVLVVANAGREIGPLGLAVPVGALGGYVVLAGIVTGLAFAARRLVAPHHEPLKAGWQHAGLGRRIGALGLGVAVLGGGGYGAAVMVAPGAPAPAVLPVSTLDGTARVTELADPGAPGPFAVRTFSYGSGTDRLRPAFGAGAALRTPTVDGTPALRQLGWGADEIRAWFWGFGLAELPLNGLVWMPVGEGPFPLVLMVHGNHAMGDFSEPGYAYLGEHLASRGLVAVSVDEDFLNGSWAGEWGGSEQLARAWLLLVHLDLWRGWTADAANELHGKVDMTRVALIGHSRGGEAASIAAMLASASSSPALGLQPWPTGLAVRAVVAIAPSDGQYDRTRVILRDTDYLTLQGGHDGDATAWMGIRQYARTVVRDGGFRAAIWSYRSNHGQFNDVWGRSDQGPLGGALLDLGPLAAPEDQRDVARTAIGAFLEASLLGRTDYRDLFRRPMLGRDWLPPDDIFLVRSSDDSFVPLTTAGASQGVPGATVTTTGFDVSGSRAVPLRSLLPDQVTIGTLLRWSPGSTPAAWELRGIGAVEAVEGISARSSLTFALANGSAPDGSADPLDLLVEARTTDGVTVRLPLSRWGALPPPLEVTLVKSRELARLSSMDVALDAPAEQVLQTYAIPVADLVAADPAFRPERLEALRLVVTRTTAGVIWITEVGVSGG